MLLFRSLRTAVYFLFLRDTAVFPASAAPVRPSSISPVQRTGFPLSPVFGVDLVEAGLAEKICAYFTELTAGPGAVRATLHKYVNAE